MTDIGGPRAVRFHVSQFALAGVLILYALSNFVIVKLVAVYLSVAEFGSLSVILALLLIATVPASAFEFYLVRFVAGERKRNRRPGGSSVRAAFLTAAVLGIGAVFLTIQGGVRLAGGLKYVDTDSLFLAGTAVFFLFQSRTALGLLSGAERYLTCAFVYFIEAAVRVVVVWAVLSAGGSTRAIMYAFAASYAASGAASIGFEIRERRRLRHVPSGDARAGIASLIKLFAAMGLLGLLLFLDVPLVGFWFKPEAAAQYAAAAVIARIALWLPLPFANTLFARVANEVNPRAQRLTLLVTVTIVVPALAMFVLFAYLHAHLLVRVFLSYEKFQKAAAIVPALLLATSVLGVTWLLYQFLLAQGRFKPVAVMLVAVVGFVLLVRFRHGSIDAVVENLRAVGLACCGVFVAWALTMPRVRHVSHHGHAGKLAHPNPEPGGSMTPHSS